MGKITRIKKSRKENVCSKCHSVIPVGSEYFKGEIRFRNPIVRCTKCGLKRYEVTTSDYYFEVGQLQEDWQEVYGTEQTALDEIKEKIDELRDEVQERRDAMPEHLQDVGTGEILGNRYDNLDQVYDELESIDVDEILNTAVEGKASDVEKELYEIITECSDIDELVSNKKIPENIRTAINEEFTSSLCDAIDEALSGLELE